MQEPLGVAHPPHATARRGVRGVSDEPSRSRRGSAAPRARTRRSSPSTDAGCDVKRARLRRLPAAGRHAAQLRRPQGRRCASTPPASSPLPASAPSAASSPESSTFFETVRHRGRRDVRPGVDRRPGARETGRVASWCLRASQLPQGVDAPTCADGWRPSQEAAAAVADAPFRRVETTYDAYLDALPGDFMM